VTWRSSRCLPSRLGSRSSACSMSSMLRASATCPSGPGRSSAVVTIPLGGIVYLTIGRRAGWAQPLAPVRNPPSPRTDASRGGSAPVAVPPARPATLAATIEITRLSKLGPLFYLIVIRRITRGRVPWRARFSIVLLPRAALKGTNSPRWLSGDRDFKRTYGHETTRYRM
jgi:hypothetical protein